MRREFGTPTIPLPAEILKRENRRVNDQEIQLIFAPELREKANVAIEDLREHLSGSPESSERLLSQCARFVEEEEQKIKKASEVYGEIFYEKELNKKEAAEIVLSRAIEVLDDIHKRVKESAGDKEKIIEEALDGLREKQKADEKAMGEIKKIAEQVNQMYAEIDQVRIDIANKEDEIWREHQRERGREVREAREKIDREEFKRKWEEQGFVFMDDDDVDDLISEIYDDTEYMIDADDGEFFSSEEEKEEYDEEIRQQRERLKKYDSYRIQREIESYERMYDKDGSNYRFAVEYLDPIDIAGYPSTSENTKRRSEEARIIFEPLVKKLEKLLRYQNNLEQKLERIIFGNESARLPKDFLKEIRSDIRNYQPEIPKTQKEIYLPVGVSSLLPREPEIHLKPIDAIGYLFWLNNQGRNAKFMVVDTIQETNYQALYNLSPEEARVKAKENGRKDKEWYKAVIDLFHLRNIKMIDFEEIEQSQAFQAAREMIAEMEEKSPIIQKALSSVVEEGVKKKALETAGKDQYGNHRNVSDEEKRNIYDLLDQYGKTEIAFILAKQGLKVGHEKEYRYDLLARILPIYRALSERSEALFKSGNVKIKNKEDRDQALVELSLYLGVYQDFPKSYHLAADLFDAKEEVSKRNRQIEQVELIEKKGASDQEKGILKEKKDMLGQEKKIFKVRAEALDEEVKQAEEESGKDIALVRKVQKTIKDLGLLRDDKQTPDRIIQKWRKIWNEIPDKAWFQSLDLPEFFHPQGVTGMSFEMADEKGIEQKGFREFYSTHKKELEQSKNLPIEANQVVASTDFMAAAKLMVLSEKLQKEYFEKILRPILVNYYITCFRGEEKGVDIKRRELNKSLALQRARHELEDIKTISDAVDFIQRKIVWPIEMELKR